MSGSRGQLGLEIGGISREDLVGDGKGGKGTWLVVRGKEGIVRNLGQKGRLG